MPNYRPDMDAAEVKERTLRVHKMLRLASRPLDAEFVGQWIEDTQMIPLRQLWDAISMARLRVTDGFMPTPGQVIDAGRDAGRWHDPRRGVMTDPWWFRSWKAGRWVPADPTEPHAPPSAQQRLTAASGTELTREEMEREARRDIEVHARHLREGLAPDTCVRCVLHEHQKHTAPVANCLRCQVGAAA